MRRSISRFNNDYTVRRWNVGRVSIVLTRWGSKRWLSATATLLDSRWP